MAEQRSDRGERGVALVELAILCSFLLLVVSATIDYGFAWRRSMEVSTTLRASTRVVAGLGTNRAADYEALRSLNAGVSEIGPANVLRVIVYRSVTSDGGVPADCLAVTPASSSSAGAGVTGRCNVYSPSQLGAITPSRFSGSASSCQNDDWDRFLCPLTSTHREGRQGASGGASYLGMWMEVRYDYVVGMLPGDGITMRDRAVMRIEPQL